MTRRSPHVPVLPAAERAHLVRGEHARQARLDAQDAARRAGLPDPEPWTDCDGYLAEARDAFQPEDSVREGLCG
jgi:hypothetical protein